MKLNFLVTGAILMALAVIAGAFGTHGLKNRISAGNLEIWEKAVLYHMIHALGIILIGILQMNSKGRKINISGLFLLSGIIFFSGSLYLLALREISFTGSFSAILGPVTPAGGLCFIAGWICLGLGNLKTGKM